MQALQDTLHHFFIQPFVLEERENIERRAYKVCKLNSIYTIYIQSGALATWAAWSVRPTRAAKPSTDPRADKAGCSVPEMYLDHWVSLWNTVWLVSSVCIDHTLFCILPHWFQYNHVAKIKKRLRICPMQLVQRKMLQISVQTRHALEAVVVCCSCISVVADCKE